MSSIHDALKTAQAKQSASVTAPAQRPKSAASFQGLWWVMLVLFLTESGLFFRETLLRRNAEDKLQKALLELNDERARTQDLLREKVDIEDKLASMQGRLDEAEKENASLVRAKQAVEVDNLEKEKKVSQMTKDLHELQMERLRLEEEAKTLRAQVESLTVLAVEPPPAAASAPEVPVQNQ